MRQAFRSRALYCILVRLLAVTCPTQGQAQVAITPARATMLAGESRSFRAIDSHGHNLTNVHWTMSSTELEEVAQGADVEVVAHQPGGFTLTARASEGSANAQVEVVDGDTLPIGTTKWSGVDWPGCHTDKILPAVPSATGVADVFEQSTCADGEYVAAYTAEGIMAWRRQLSGKNGGSPSAVEISAATLLNTKSASICDSISEHMKKEAVQALLAARHLSTSSQTETAWLVEEDGTECRIWFDAQAHVTKKRKILVAE